jgi:hypothetical protein
VTVGFFFEDGPTVNPASRDELTGHLWVTQPQAPFEL